jgi:Arc/MetJ-type ribon-helix-helix transcriptional regulator
MTNKHGTSSLKIISVYLPEEDFTNMDKLKDLYSSHSELIRVAVHDFLAQWIEKRTLPQFAENLHSMAQYKAKIAKAKELLQQASSKKQIQRCLKQQFGTGLYSPSLADLEFELRKQKKKEKMLDLLPHNEQGNVHEEKIKSVPKEVMKTI